MTDNGATSLGLLGKHPAYGDFLRLGMDPGLSDPLNDWVQAVMSEIRTRQGDNWSAFWEIAQELRFWIGRGIMGRTLAGVLRPSQDKVGRRYPLILLLDGPSLPPPAIDSDQAAYRALADAMGHIRPGRDAASIFAQLAAEAPVVPAETEAEATVGPVLWAHRPDGDLDALLADAGPEDHVRAATLRSYWWSEPERGLAPCWLACPGLPTSEALEWCLAGAEAPSAPRKDGPHE